MAGEARRAEERIRRGRGDAGTRPSRMRSQARERLVLTRLVGKRIGALQLDADREIVASRPAAVLRWSRVPGPVEKRDVLRHRSVPFDQGMGRDPELRDLPERGMFRRVQVVAEEARHRAAAELARRKADPVNDDEVDLRPDGPGIEVGRRTQARTHEPSVRTDGGGAQIFSSTTDCSSSIW